jgi:hypothetical protein
MLKMHCKEWKDTNLIKVTKAAMKKEHNKLLQKLATPAREQGGEMSQAVEDNLTAVDENGLLAAAGTDDNDDSKHDDGNGPAFPLGFELVNKEPQQPQRHEVQVAPLMLQNRWHVCLPRKVERTRQSIAATSLSAKRRETNKKL